MNKIELAVILDAVIDIVETIATAILDRKQKRLTEKLVKQTKEMKER